MITSFGIVETNSPDPSLSSISFIQSNGFIDQPFKFNITLKTKKGTPFIIKHSFIPFISIQGKQGKVTIVTNVTNIMKYQFTIFPFHSFNFCNTFD
jgi:hypothetical protein